MAQIDADTWRPQQLPDVTLYEGTCQKGWMGTVNLFLNKKRKEKEAIGIGKCRASLTLTSLSKSEVLTLRPSNTNRVLRCPVCFPCSKLHPPAHLLLSFLWHPFPGAKPSNQSAGPRWCSGGLGNARGSPHTILPLASLPPALSHHTYLSCRIRLELLPSEPDKEATGQGRDRDKDTKQEWQKEGGDRAQGSSCRASEGKQQGGEICTLTKVLWRHLQSALGEFCSTWGNNPACFFSPPDGQDGGRKLKAERLT